MLKRRLRVCLIAALAISLAGLLWSVSAQTPTPAEEMATLETPVERMVEGWERMPAAIEPVTVPETILAREDDELMEFSRSIVISAERHNWLLLIQFLAVLVLFLPVVPSLREIYRPKDDKPLNINMEYAKDPRYFDKAFRHMIKGAMSNEDPGMQMVSLSKQDRVEVIKSTGNQGNGEALDHILFVTGDLSTEASARFDKEIYVSGRAQIGKLNSLRALVCDGDVDLGEGTVVTRWVGSPGTIRVSDNCVLGVRTACDEDIFIGRNTFFRSLYGKQIHIGEGADNALVMNENERPESLYQKKQKKKRKNGQLWMPRRVLVPSKTRRKKDIDSKRDLVIGEDSHIEGNVRTRGKLTLNENVIIEGDVMAEKDIIIKRGCVIRGRVLSKMSIYVAEDFVLGAQEAPRSMIAKGELEIGEESRIYGSLKAGTELQLHPKILVTGGIFSEENIEVAYGCDINENVFAQGKIAFSRAIKVGRPGSVKSVIAKKGINIAGEGTFYGLVSTDGDGVVA